MTVDRSPDDADQLAGEYVLGTLTAAERRAVESRAHDEPLLREALERWEARLLPLTRLAEPVAPPSALWQRIESTLDLASAGAASAPAATAATAATTAPAPATPDASGAPPALPASPPRAAPAAPARTTPTPRPSAPAAAGWWHSLGLWRGLAASGLALSLALAVTLATRIGEPPAAARYMVVLVAPGNQVPGWVVQATSERRISLTPLAATSVPADKALQFWTKADDWSGPVSLGLVAPGQPTNLTLDTLPPLVPNQLFELTLEPATGSPTGRPTGPIQFIGRAVQVL